MSILNIPLEGLRNQSIISICNDLGCEIEYPKHIENKYLEKIKKEGKIDKDIQIKFKEEQEKIDIIWDEQFNKYMNELVKWLENKEWMKDNEKDLKELIKEVRDLGYTIKSIAEATNINMKTLYNYNSGRAELSKDKKNQIRMYLNSIIK